MYEVMSNLPTDARRHMQEDRNQAEGLARLFCSFFDYDARSN
jgi:hypothetical protein